MPIYEYRCGKCEHRFEHFVRSSKDRSPRVCSQCGSRRVNRVFSAFGVGTGAAPGPSMNGGGGGCCSGGGCACRG